jgi:hypothetical protein
MLSPPSVLKERLLLLLLLLLKMSRAEMKRALKLIETINQQTIDEDDDEEDGDGDDDFTAMNSASDFSVVLITPASLSMSAFNPSSIADLCSFRRRRAGAAPSISIANELDLFSPSSSSSSSS